LVLFLISSVSLAANGQQQSQKTKPSPSMGVATGAAHPAVKDSKSRPITAGGFVDDAPVIFLDVTAQAGLNKFHHRSGTPEKKTIIGTPGAAAGRPA